jgi:hypothetical protein
MWPLGLEITGFNIADRLLPGINTTVVRPRYYAFFAWAFWTYEHARSTTTLTQREWLDRLEMVVRLCTQTRAPGYVGLVGTRSIGPVFSPAETNISLVDREVVSAYSAAFYASSFAQLGCTTESTRAREVALSEAVGVPLADAFDRDVRLGASRADALAWVLSDTPSVPAWVIFSLQDSLALRDVAPQEAVHPLLVDLFVRLRAPDDPGNTSADDARTRSMVFLLDLLAQLPGGLENASVVHEVFATRTLPTGDRLRTDPVWDEAFRGWERYQERQFEKLALYGMWSVLVEVLQEGTSRPVEIMKKLIDELGDSELLSTWVGEGALRRDVASARTEILEKAQLCPRDAGGTMIDFVALIQDQSADLTLGDRAAAAVLLLLLAVSSWASYRETAEPWEIGLHRIGGPGRLALEPVREEVLRRGADPLEEFVRWMMGSAVIGQANRVALEKMVRGDANIFLLRDEQGYRARSGLTPWKYVYYDNPAVYNAYSLLAGLHLVDMSDGFRLTDTGHSVLDRAQAHLRCQAG